MARPRTATNVLALRGAFAHDPARGRAREGEMPTVGELGEPPEFLSPSEAVAWRELRAMLPDGVSGRADQAHFAMVSKLYAALKMTPILEMPPSHLGRLMAGLGLLGMNPADRSRVKVGTKAPTNPFLDDE